MNVPHVVPVTRELRRHIVVQKVEMLHFRTSFIPRLVFIVLLPAWQPTGELIKTPVQISLIISGVKNFSAIHTSTIIFLALK